MIGLEQIKARVKRLADLERGFAAELSLWERPLGEPSIMESHWYTRAVDAAIQNVRDARRSLQNIIERLEFEARVAAAENQQKANGGKRPG